MKFWAKCSFKWLVLLILFEIVHHTNSAATQGKCENCTNLQELSLALAILGIVSVLFITLCLCRCLPKFTQIIFANNEQLNAVHRAQHTQRLSQILKRQHRLRAQQLATQSSNLSTNQHTNLLEKGILQDPFLADGILGSVLLTPTTLSLPPQGLTIGTPIKDEQQVNDALKSNKNNSSIDSNESKTTPLSQKNKRVHHPMSSFSIAAQAAAAATHMLHQQRSSTLRKQLAKRNFEQQKQNKLKDPSFSSSFDQPQEQTVNKSLTRFLKRSNVIRPVQLQHSLSLTSFAALPKNNKILDQLTGPLNSQLKPIKSANFKQPIKYPGVDKNIVTLNQQPITLDSLYATNKTQQPKINQSIQFGLFDRNQDNSNKLVRQNRLYSKSVQNIEQLQKFTWLDQQLISDDLNDEDLPALPIELLTNSNKSKQSYTMNEFQKSRSMPMLFNNQSDALFTPCYLNHEHDHSEPFTTVELDEDQLNSYAAFNNSACHFQNNKSRYPDHHTVVNYDEIYTDSHPLNSHHLNSSMNQVYQHNTQDDTFHIYHQDHQRRFTNQFGSNHQLDSDASQHSWPDAQLEQFLNASNHYTQQKSANRIQARSLFDLY